MAAKNNVNIKAALFLSRKAPGGWRAAAKISVAEKRRRMAWHGDIIVPHQRQHRRNGGQRKRRGGVKAKIENKRKSEKASRSRK